MAVVLTEAQGRHGGMVHGGASRGQAAVWQAGNLIEARWRARLADQLGSLGGELVHPTAALALEDPLALALLSAACAVAGEALPEREAHPRLFRGYCPSWRGWARRRQRRRRDCCPTISAGSCCC